jgi:hypothetical protein
MYEVVFDDTNNCILNISERYLCQLEEDAQTEQEKIAMGAMSELYALGKIDFYIDVYEIDPRNRLKFYPNDPS